MSRDKATILETMARAVAVGREKGREATNCETTVSHLARQISCIRRQTSYARTGYAQSFDIHTMRSPPNTNSNGEVSRPRRRSSLLRPTRTSFLVACTHTYDSYRKYTAACIHGHTHVREYGHERQRR